MTDAINTLNAAPRAEELQRLSPLASAHVNMLGRFSFDLPDPIKAGERRPLREPKRQLRAA